MIVNETFVDIDDVVESILDSDFVNNFVIVGKYDEAKIVLKKIISDDNKMPVFVELEDPCWRWYDKEFLISASRNHDDVFCEKAYRSDEYIDVSDDFVFVLPSCSKEFVDYMRKNNSDIECFIISYPDDDEIKDEYISNDVVDVIECRDDDGNIGFIVSYGDREYYLDLNNVITSILGIDF